MTRWSALDLGISGTPYRFAWFYSDRTNESLTARFNNARQTGFPTDGSYDGLIVGVINRDLRIDPGPVVEVEAAGALAFGDYIRPSSDGRAQKATDKYTAIGRCLTQGVVAGDIILATISVANMPPDKPAAAVVVPSMRAETALPGSGYSVGGSFDVYGGGVTLQRVVASGQQANIPSGQQIYLVPALGTDQYFWGANARAPKTALVQQQGNNAGPYHVDPYFYDIGPSRISIAFRNPYSTGSTVSQVMSLMCAFTW